MSDTDRNNLVAEKLRELADLFAGVAQGAGPVTDEKKPKAKKTPPAPPADDAPPAENDKTITPDHPKRLALQQVAKEYREKTNLAAAQKAMALFGDGSKNVSDEELLGAIAHFKNLLKQLPVADDGEV